MKKYVNYKIIIGTALLIYIAFFILKMNLYYIDTFNDSDIAAEYLLARMQAKEHSLFSRNWYYSYDIRVVYLQLIATPLFYFTSNYYVVLGFTNLIWTLFFALSYFFVAKVIGITFENIIFTLPLILTAFSNQTIYYMYGGGFYLPYVTWLFLVLGLVLLAVKRKSRILFLLVAVLSLILGLGGFRYMALLFLPMLMGALLAFFHECEKLTLNDLKESLYFSYVFATFFSCVFAVVGFLINRHYLAKVYSFEDLNDRGFVMVSDLLNQIFSFGVSFVKAFGYNSGVDLFSLSGIANCVAFLLFLMILYVGYRIIQISKTEHIKIESKIFLYFCGCVFIVLTFISVFTGTMSQYKYVIHAFELMLILIGIYLTYEKENLSKFFFSILTVFVVIYLNGVSYKTEMADGNCLLRKGYIDYLISNEYTYGYATFWNCDITAFMCNNDTQVVPIKDVVTLEKYNWLADKEIFDPLYNTSGKYFVLLTTEEIDDFFQSGNVGSGEIGYVDEEFVIYTYKGNGF